MIGKKMNWKIGLIVLLLSTIYVCETYSEKYTVVDSVFRNIEVILELQNIGNEPVHGVSIYYGSPVSLPEQEILELRWLPTPTRFDVDIFGQKLAYFYFDKLFPHQIRTIKLNATGIFRLIRYDVEPESVGALRDIPIEILDLYTLDGPFYRITDPFIIETARTVVGEEKNPYLMAIRIHDYIASTLKYDLTGGWDDAPTVLKRGAGSCSEFTFAFIALARAVGLPARFVGGSYCPADFGRRWYQDDTAHRWVEIYIPNYGWVPFDATLDRPTSEHDFVSHTNIGYHDYYCLVMVQGGGTDEGGLGIWYPFRVTTGNNSQLQSIDITWMALWK